MYTEEEERIIEIVEQVYTIREKIGYSIADMAELLELDPFEYMVLEAGDLEQPVEAYEILLDIMQDLRDANNSIVEDILESEQYKYSEKLLDIRYGAGLTQKEVADRLDMDYEHYVGLESCYLAIPVEEYIKAVEKAEEAINGNTN